MIDEKDVVNIMLLHMRAVIDAVDSHKVDADVLIDACDEEAADADSDWQAELWSALAKYIHEEDISIIKH